MAVIARIAYGLVFCVVVPAMLVLWARATEGIIRLPVYGGPLMGAFLGGTGLLLMAAGAIALWRRGGGLPMNAFPPPKLVRSGIYALLPHPIYTGFCLLCFGAAISAKSASGLWLVAPAAALGCAAIVYGYEKPDLTQRFGGEPLKALAILPPPTGDRPTFAERLRFLLFVLVPWFAIYEIVAALGVQPGSFDTRLSFERRLPVWLWTEPVYASVYVAALAAPMLARSRRDLRLLTIRCWLAMITVFPIYLCLPTHAPFRPFEGGGWTGRLLRLERSLDMPGEALPSFHVIWAMLAACTFRSRTAGLWAAGVALSCVANGMHAVADVIAGLVWSLGLLRYERIWKWMISVCEGVANSWREWRIGRFRLISHAFYAGLATFVCLAIVACLTDDLRMVAFTAAAALVGAGLWAQSIEGSSRLLRPFGFYGGLFGVMAASWAAPNPWLLMGAYSVAGPWLQGLGRLRCLVQGCCHGRPADYRYGIRYLHPRSRVCRISALTNVPLHPTPLYSILTNLFTGLAVARLWWIGAPPTLVGGVFLILNGIGRFIEEAYRGEPQTPVFGGLRLYQWISIATVVAGAAITAIPSEPAPPPHFSGMGILFALAFGIVAGLALGFDAPESTRRFGRLT